MQMILALPAAQTENGNESTDKNGVTAGKL
jgi:hypothetical protein